MVEETKKAVRKGNQKKLPGKDRGSTSITLRSQIVSPELCDDVLAYIAGSLEQYKGCDILDINPGAGVWSQKLHEFLKPRTHVLLEPNPDLFSPFLGPLLNAPDSKYKLVKKDVTMFESYHQLVNEDIFPQQVRKTSEDPNSQELNTTLLVTGSLMWDPRLPGLAFDTMSKQMYFQFCLAAWTNQVIHAWGPVRTLFWVETEEFHNMIAKAPTYMQKSNRLLEMIQDIQTVVTSERGHRGKGKSAPGREAQYEIESTIRALKSAQKGGFKVPEHRKRAAHVYAAIVDEASGGTGISSALFLQELAFQQALAGNPPTQFATQQAIDTIEMGLRVQEMYPDVRVPLLHPLNMENVGPGRSRPKDPPEIAEYKLKRHKVVTILRNKHKVEAVADIGEEMLKLEIKALKLEDGPEREELIKKIKELDEAWDVAVTKLHKNYSYAATAEMDDRISLRYPPHPRIQWDRRPFDPLIASEDEIWPQKGASLISSTPIPRPVGDIPDFHEWVTDVTFGLYNDVHKSLPAALDAMQHGLSDIMKKCPSLTDPDKGGRLQLKHLRVRMLTVEMIHELTRAYIDWPFKMAESARNNFYRNRHAKPVEYHLVSNEGSAAIPGLE
ncbi:hypothetical protein ACEQ8H_000899 [Pleosporales sp. CAS-2024a]